MENSTEYNSFISITCKIANILISTGVIEYWGVWTVFLCVLLLLLSNTLKINIFFNIVTTICITRCRIRQSTTVSDSDWGEWNNSLWYRVVNEFVYRLITHWNIDVWFGVWISSSIFLSLTIAMNHSQVRNGAHPWWKVGVVSIKKDQF